MNYQKNKDEKNKLLYLPIETTARELDGKLLLAHRALSRGYSIVLGRKGYVKKVAQRLRRGIYFYKDHSKEGFPSLKQTEYFYKVSLDEEGLLFLNNKFFLNRAIPNELDYLKAIFTWGKLQKEMLMKVKPNLCEKIIPIGNPRFDLLRPEYKVLYRSTYKKLEKKFGRYILINTNFGPGNFNCHYKISYLENIKKAFLIKSEKDQQFYCERVKFYEKLFEAYSSMVAEVAKMFPNINFILRPHPSEDHGNWRKTLKGLRNVKVIYEGSATAWMYGSIGIIHTGCTTGIESWALDKPVLRYNPEPNMGYEPALPNKLGYNLTSVDSLARGIENILKKQLKGTFKEQIKVVKPYIDSIDGKSSSERIMDALDKIIDSQEEELIRSQNMSISSIHRADKLKSRMKIKFLKILKIAGFVDTRIGKKFTNFFITESFQKFTGISQTFIRLRLKQFDEIHGNNVKDKLSIKKVGADTYILEKKV